MQRTKVKARFYTQLMVLVGMVTTAAPLAAHEFHDTGYYANGTLYIMWHDMTHAVSAFVAQMSPVYVLGLTILVAILAYIAFKVKRSDHVTSSQGKRAFN
ncbi:hypothetical protein [Kaarinaea lacus]